AAVRGRADHPAAPPTPGCNACGHRTRYIPCAAPPLAADAVECCPTPTVILTVGGGAALSSHQRSLVQIQPPQPIQGPGTREFSGAFVPQRYRRKVPTPPRSLRELARSQPCESAGVRGSPARRILGRVAGHSRHGALKNWAADEAGSWLRRDR